MNKKNQLLQENAKKELNILGYKIHDIEGDGNCLFRAISHQIYNTDKYHYFIRRFACDYLEMEKSFFSNYVEIDINLYIQNMKNEGVWGGHLEIQAISELYQRSILIYSLFSEPMIIYNKNFDNPMMLFFKNLNHYESIKYENLENKSIDLGDTEYQYLIKKKINFENSDGRKDFSENAKYSLTQHLEKSNDDDNIEIAKKLSREEYEANNLLQKVKNVKDINLTINNELEKQIMNMGYDPLNIAIAISIVGRDINKVLNYLNDHDLS